MHWISLLIHSAAILAAAHFLGYFPRKLSAPHRHRLLLAGFGLLLLWPLLSAITPQIPIPFWSYWRTSASVTVEETTFVLRSHAVAPHVFDWSAAVWIAGALLALTPVVLGHLSVFRIAHRAVRLSDDTANHLLQTLCDELRIARMPVLLVVSAPVVPLTFGLRQPRILLPAEYTQWTSIRQRTVLLHELAHIQRRDVLSQFFVNLMTALWWFQPLCWMNGRSLRRESERACDALVLASGVRPSDYATQLLEIAHAFSQGQRWPSAAITVVRRGELETRLHSILSPQPGNKAQKRSFVAVAVLALWSIAASAITLNPQQKTTSSGGIFMKRTLLSGLLSSVGLSAASIGGSLFDPSGAAVSQAKASLYNPETKATEETTTAQDGKFTFNSLPAGQYILRVDKPGFASLFREFNVQAESKLERGLTLKLGAGEESRIAEVAKGGRPAYAQSLDPRQIRIGGQVAQSNLVTKVQPVYPDAAKAAAIQGTVNLEAVISKDGVPEEIRVMSSPDDNITQSALEAVRQWRYRPTLLNGEPVEVITDIVVNYTLLP